MSVVPIERSLTGVRRRLTVMRVAYWLGWQIESNWTSRGMFLTYAVARPIGSVLILVAMFAAVGRSADRSVMHLFVVGSAFWPFVTSGMQGMAAGLVKDREQWRTLRDVYTAPMPFSTYLVGRALAQSTAASAACVVTLAVGGLVLGVPFTLDGIGYVAVAFALGIGGVIALGLLVTAAMLAMSAQAVKLPEAVAGSLFLLSGVVFPSTVLPGVLAHVGSWLPLSWWLAALRRGILASVPADGFASWSDAGLLTMLAAVVAVWGLVAVAVFGWAERRARRAGVLDRDSGS